MTALLWLRRDLRLHDHPALRAALAAEDRVVPVFCLDPRLLTGRHQSGPRTQFLLESLADVRASLRDRGSDLVIRTGRPEDELPGLAAELGATAVHLSSDAGPFPRRRDIGVRAALRRIDVGWHEHPGLFVDGDPAALRTQSGGPYTVFTPFYKAWVARPRRALEPLPRTLPSLPSGLRRGRLPSLESLGLTSEVTDPAPGGEGPARRRCERFLTRGVDDYATAHDLPGTDGTSRLSPYLHLGCISPLELESRLGGGEGAEAFRRQLCWRDFYAHVLANFPANARSEFQERYRGTIGWRRAETQFDAWREGRTGYPLVDAGMRQLRHEGWMHNRVRLVVGSFLTKDLGIDWRWGERWFMRMLLDGDEANNNGNWQWIASVGVDPQPPYRRLYNPARHQGRFDPDGVYVRRFVPELATVPDRYLAEPWTMPVELQVECGCVIGEDYPAPIVDHLQARREALERFRAAAR
jgi:deoxyribodipyrimidine photo-lyase